MPVELAEKAPSDGRRRESNCEFPLSWMAAAEKDFFLSALLGLGLALSTGSGFTVRVWG